MGHAGKGRSDGNKVLVAVATTEMLGVAQIVGCTAPDEGLALNEGSSIADDSNCQAASWKNIQIIIQKVLKFYLNAYHKLFFGLGLCLVIYVK